MIMESPATSGGGRFHYPSFSSLANHNRLGIQVIQDIMDIVIDTSVLVAIIIGEPEKDEIIRLTSGHSLISPGSVPWEVGNAFSAMFKIKRLSIEEALKGIAIFQNIPVRYTSINLPDALSLSEQTNIYAYDAYLLDCAIRYNAELLTLDKKLIKIAKNLNIGVLEV